MLSDLSLHRITSAKIVGFRNEKWIDILLSNKNDEKFEITLFASGENKDAIRILRELRDSATKAIDTIEGYSDDD